MAQMDFPVRKDWQKELSPEQYKVLREKATEAPFTGKYVDEHAQGMYHCAACGNRLFASTSKFDSGSGWPSYAEAVPGSVILEPDTDHGLARTEVRCAKCGSHLGHVFEDGPQKTGGKRYCINSVCLNLQREPDQTI